ncbi:preprotein translocase subunit SecG [Candidatus Methylacidithermus pantelleriae]|uniref:Protein-export membrane protein SecG n=1 Tax=Candidatus Methylacidithermus pantelleriae TaxID=2744239 RepID=A0A8J2BI70_9BACT|nr:preprotein translocase subunit SecG [Candidatus Methylacidithermus pantelleriae]CAF0692518.1 Protein-export membrane protein SecG [Candidatus Methylacidithermus pantelleriae]
MLNLLIGFFWILYLFICLLLVFIILMQRSRQEGLGAAFGSSVTEAIFGAQTSSVLIKATAWLAGMFFTLAIILAFLLGQRELARSSVQKRLRAIPPPVAGETQGQKSLPSPQPADKKR